MQKIAVHAKKRSAMRIGVDIGGTKIEIVALDPTGAARLRRRVPTPAGDYAATLQAVVELTRSAEAELGARASVGVGAPGAIKNSNSTVLIGKPLQADLEARLERPIRIANDADCFTISESSDGAGAWAAIVFGVILGTGVGGGIAVQRRLLAGRNAIAGEWGHNPLPWPRDDERPGPRCYCGKHGCLETFLSGPALARAYFERSGRALEAAAVAAAALAGDEAAQACLACYEDRLARGLATVINVIDPDAIVLGGGLSNVAQLAERVAQRLPRYVFSDAVSTAVVRAQHGDSSGVRGAAMLWPLTSG